MNISHQASAINSKMPLFLIIGTSLVALCISIISLLSGWLTIFQNLFYIPIILACVYYTRRGFIYSVLLSCTYFILMLFFSQDPVVLEGALIRVLIFVLVAGVVTYISTARMQAEDALRESEARYSSLFDNNYSISLLIDPDTGRIVEANEAACQYYGFSREQMLAQGIFDLNRLPMDKVVKDLQQAKHEGRKHFYSTHYRASGERRDVEIYSGPITVQGKPLFYSIIHDITDRKRAEEALRESEKRYRDFFTTSRDAVFITSPDGRWIDFNDTALEMFGYSRREELMALPLAALYEQPEDRRALMRLIDTNDYVKEYPVRLMRKDGSVIDTLITSVPLREEDGPIKAFIGSIRDITERKKAEMELSASKQLIESIIDTIPARVFWKDRNLVYLGCNTQFANDAGFSRPEEIIGKNDFQMGWCDQAEKYQADDRAVIEGGKARLFIEEPQTTPQGTTIHLLTSKVPLPNEEGEVIGVLGTYLDITERKRAEHQILLNAARNKVLLRLHGMGATASEQEILNFAMEGSLEITGSRFAFAGLINDDESEMTIHAWSKDVMEQCAVTDKVFHFPVKDLGLLGECMRQRSPLIINDYAGPHPSKHGYPEGHVTIRRFVMVPLLDENRIVAVAAVANKETEYTEDDTDAVARLYYQMWEIIARKRVEEALRQSEEQLRVIFHNQQTGILIIDPANHVISDANAMALAMIGAPREDVVGRICHNFICTAEQGKCPVTDLGQVIDKSERVLLTKPGTSIPVLKSVNLITMKGKQYIIDSFIDITDRKRAEEALHQVNKKLQLMSSITRHDILNQLMVLRGYLELSGDYINDPVRLKEFIEKEEKAAATIESQIRFTRDYQDLGLQAPSWQHVRACIERAVELLPMRTIQVDIAGPDLEIFADPLCEKVFYNLIDNALRYGGERMTTISFSGRESDQGMTLMVEDDGAGISPEDRKRLFERGFGKNTGLGLFLSREILSITGITITETGTPGRGARFEIAIPLGAYRIRNGK